METRDRRSEVWAVANDKGDELTGSSIKFNYYFPIDRANATQKKDGRPAPFPYETGQFKLAADQVAYLDFNESLKLLSVVVSDFKQKIPNTNPNVVALNKALDLFLENANKEEYQQHSFAKLFSCDNKKDFSDGFKQLQQALNYVIDNPKNSKLDTDEKKKLCRELRVWLDGIYIRAQTLPRLDAFKAKLVEPENRKVNHPLQGQKLAGAADVTAVSAVPAAISDFSQIPNTYADILMEMKDMDGKESLPIVLMLMDEMRRMTERVAAAQLKPYDVALRLLNESNIRQHQGNTSNNRDFVSNIRTGFLPRLQELIEEVKNIKDFPEIANHAKLLMLLMEGMYIHAHFIPQSDLENMLFYTASKGFVPWGVGIYKADVAIYYFYASIRIREVIQAYEDAIKLSGHPTAQSAMTARAADVASPNAAAATTTPSSVVAAVATLPPPISTSDDTISNGINVSESTRRLNLLSCSGTPESKLACFENILSDPQFTFTEDENNVLRFSEAKLKRELLEYKDNITTASRIIRDWVPYLGFYAQKTHAEDADDFLNCHLTPSAAGGGGLGREPLTPTRLIREEIAFYNRLNGSHDLKPRILETICMQYDQLVSMHYNRLQLAVPYPAIRRPLPEQRSSMDGRRLAAAPQYLALINGQANAASPLALLASTQDAGRRGPPT